MADCRYADRSELGKCSRSFDLRLRAGDFDFGRCWKLEVGLALVLHKLRDPTFDLDPVSTVKQVDRIDGCQLIGHIQFMAELPIAGPNPHKRGGMCRWFPFLERSDDRSRMVGEYSEFSHCNFSFPLLTLTRRASTEAPAQQFEGGDVASSIGYIDKVGEVIA
jgi:hypothetical protein